MTDAFARLAAALADRYRIERELGEGGMATVYLAEDLKHNRKVAIKVLKPELAAVLGAERFVQEIATTAQLQHPNILPLFDSGTAEGFLYYVMPYIEGETLRARLDRETQLGVDESVKLVSEVADALQYAHEQGVVHRDIKPENILLHAGRPMVADFGIALAVSAAAGGRMTETGLSLGTPHYMSPEQATAEKVITARSDIYSLGSVMYEMLTGQPPHLGGSAQQIIVKIIADPARPVGELRKSVPPNVAAAVAKALEKLPADRFETAKGLVDALANPAFRHGEEGVGAGGATAVGRWKVASFALGTVAVLTVAAFVAAVLRPGADASVSGRQIRFTVLPDSGVYLGGFPNARWGRPGAPALALSPDGTLLVYAGWKLDAAGNRASQLYLHPLDQERSQAIPGTDSASIPFFSPDGKWLGFFSGRSLKRLNLSGGNVQTVVQTVPMRGAVPGGASWGDDHSIVYSTADGIYRVNEEGGTPELLVNAQGDTATAEGLAWSEFAYAEPQLLPGDHALLFHLRGRRDPKSAVILALDLASGRRTTLLDDAMHPLFVAPDHLLFMRQGTLMSVGFDPDRLRITGEPRVVMEDVMQSVSLPNTGWEVGAGQVAISRSGDLAWIAGGTYPEVPMDVLEVAPDGHATPLGWTPANYQFPRVSAQGDRVVYAVGPAAHKSLEIRDLARAVPRRVNTGAWFTFDGEWSPGADSLVYASDADDGTMHIYKVAADGSGKPVELPVSGQDLSPASWSSQGVIAYLQAKDGRPDIWTLAPGGEPTPFVATDSADYYATFSPDGRMLAYVSNATGLGQVYVRPYPGPGAETQVSANGGAAPAWSRDGSRLYYEATNGEGGRAMMVVDVVSQEPFRVGRARTLIDPWPYEGTGPWRDYDVLPNGSFIATLYRVPAGLHPKPGFESTEMYRADTVHVITSFLSGLRGKTQ